ncbi:MAG: hypothetical protein A3I89_02830 [Candidatus Harrisonbacteria bacterium RIFCSPLOWO2_02_FULL_41_11]|uniref:Uncharacterized protein n=1 Tax=Candidatus Harrisonbacteria bacterium RIFCSPHIGHO2_02_FULL_42_16 TaxID=1798404 RepID=A0A1G1ZHL2_9BACT|nr:MAG: hypothetical protein A3B92_03285 [Candidatus Harrisonbacteria bacterium RIFCSPHIGHO2_02_FULL_42_16]OGY67321.1 MAG: hypothetical protein A3I89_02830 [Candidatus Harrisonbacteria bacterium RIFCSPLOWO2_02_FULL_41_11]
MYTQKLSKYKNILIFGLAISAVFIYFQLTFAQFIGDGNTPKLLREPENTGSPIAPEQKSTSPTSFGNENTIKTSSDKENTIGTSDGLTIKIPNPLGTNNLAELINTIISRLIFLGAPIVTLMILIGAFQILTAAGDEQKIITARRTILYTVIGYALLLLSAGITSIIKDILSG